MKARTRSAYPLRAALLVAGSLAVAAVSNGCSAAPSEQTGESGQAVIIRNPEPGPIFLDVITTKTGDKEPNGSVCPSEFIPVPTALAGYGCTLGVEITSDPALVYRDGTAFPSALDPEGNAVQAYAWACLDTVPVSALDDAINTDLASFGGPDLTLPSHFIAEVNPTSLANSCYGLADTGYVIVLESFDDTRIHHHPGGSGCDVCGTEVVKGK